MIIPSVTDLGNTMNNSLSVLQVLIIDDEVAMRGIVKGVLKSIGIRTVLEASNGAEGLAILKANKTQCDVIMCDLYMDQMDGMQFCNMIRKDETLRNRQIPIIIMTSEDNPLVLDVVRQVGAGEILVKPISPVDLKSAIERLVGFSGGKTTAKAV
jgi:two-component system, chemotaxis family, chemotaxis protein CheY